MHTRTHACAHTHTHRPTNSNGFNLNLFWSDSHGFTGQPEPPSKRNKFSGAFRHKTKLNTEWRKQWPICTPVPGNPYCFRCTCSKILACGHQGAAYIGDHASTKCHKQLAMTVLLGILPSLWPKQKELQWSIITFTRRKELNYLNFYFVFS